MNIFQRLKSCFKKAVPAPSFKTKVQPYDRNKEYYCILYSVNGGLTWNEITEASTPFDDPWLWKLDHPVMFKSFDDAVEEAKRNFASLDLLRTHLATQKALYKNKLSEAAAKLGKRDKIWESD